MGVLCPRVGHQRYNTWSTSYLFHQNNSVCEFCWFLSTWGYILRKVEVFAVAQGADVLHGWPSAHGSRSVARPCHLPCTNLPSPTEFGLHPPRANSQGRLHSPLPGAAKAAPLLSEVCLLLKASCSPRHSHHSSPSEEARVEGDQPQTRHIQTIPAKLLKTPVPEDVHLPEGRDFSPAIPKWKVGK